MMESVLIKIQFKYEDLPQRTQQMRCELSVPDLQEALNGTPACNKLIQKWEAQQLWPSYMTESEIIEGILC